MGFLLFHKRNRCETCHGAFDKYEELVGHSREKHHRCILNAKIVELSSSTRRIDSITCKKKIGGKWIFVDTEKVDPLELTEVSAHCCMSQILG
jgi:hypothetical protein